MLVKAKHNVKDETGWHMTGEVFDAKSDLGSAVEILEPAVPEKAEPAEATETKPKARRKKSE